MILFNLCFKVKEYLKLPIHPHSTVYVCVRAFSYAGNKITKCTKPHRNFVGILSSNAVYDMDAAAETWINVLNVIIFYRLLFRSLVDIFMYKHNCIASYSLL